MPDRSDTDLARHVATLEERIRRLEVDLASFASEPKSIPIGGGFTYTEGAGSRLGVDAMVAGAVVVGSTVVTASSRIFVTSQSNTVTGALRISARSAGVSFTITSNNGLDAGSVAWVIFEPA